MGADRVLLFGEDATEGQDAAGADGVDEVIGVDAEDVADDIGEHDIGSAGEPEAFFKPGVVESHRLIGDAVLTAIGDAHPNGFWVAIEAGNATAAEFGGGEGEDARATTGIGHRNFSRRVGFQKIHQADGTEAGGRVVARTEG